MMGSFGYELDPGTLSDEEKQNIRAQMAEYRKYEKLIMQGLYYRLTDPYTQEVGAWEFVSEDQSEALVNAVMLEVHGNMTQNYLRLKGLREGCMYQEEASQKVYPANALMESGIPLPVEFGEYHAYQMHFIRIK